ncbi:PP-loop domain protein [Anaeromyxobacter dehalogenans 2CP-1]|uniref:tRNA-cytidine(32) 2-sulfurtransferase n=1 Tax=Anaeromyxobacter dehalogenans (strain ATCC BAA-258 / DSM 21875 / 2CP-1) TaxID=455488 RepID=TTCA_ANAD2|nr:tRNA 2-thiocytidine(32) synthetase TtcA [Anaeromyxobacter dehalogenans]B8JEH9.1 RecName: Full=tRNA-cytidine(32) 2-sulfurtransferase; AltName: Full=Two-thiocytidine biosynthesis protein A; AltName: Full=tRNA 2-thiocytidine biosynthesis protein TtcA [Anaeromyxobacter dehalogenans 2CP-1]ACL64305.1 PP-loop domain protein [Anaeromyxobacter dehalogenans 2CP-1]
MQQIHRLERKLLRATAEAIRDFDLVSQGDRIMVAVSGGKDSYTLLHLLMRLRERAPIDFDLVAVNLDQGQPGFPAQVVEDHLRSVGVPYRMLQRDTYSVVRRLVPEGKTTCPVCSRLRRGVLYNAAVEMGCTKIALGHHRDDLVETLLLSALYSGALKSMPPKLRSRDGRNVVVRPLCYAAEEDVAAFAEAMRFPIVPCDLCGSQPNLRRKRVKRLLAELSAEHPAVKGNLLHALAHVVPSHLLDRDLHRQLADATGRDPWLDAEDEEAEDCGEPPAGDGVVSLGGARGGR